MQREQQYTLLTDPSRTVHSLIQIPYQLNLKVFLVCINKNKQKQMNFQVKKKNLKYLKHTCMQSQCSRCCVPTCIYPCRTLELFLEVYTSSCENNMINSSQKSCTHTCQLNIINLSRLLVKLLSGGTLTFSKMYQIRTWIMLRLSEQQYESG